MTLFLEKEKVTTKVIAWDIGLKNLSYCILQKTNTKKEDIGETNKKEDIGETTKHDYKIIDWEVINLYPEEVETIYKCVGVTGKKQICGKKAKYKYDISIEEKCNYYCKTHNPSDKTTVEIKKAKQILKNKNPFEYAKRIKYELDKRPCVRDVDAVIIENQPALVNPIMKTVQIIILSYFSFNSCSENPFIVQNINAKRKEKLPEEDKDWENSEYKKQYLTRIEKIKNKYSRRKLLCFYYANMCLETSPLMKNFLLNHKKKDDLTDSFLMCTDWFLRK